MMRMYELCKRRYWNHNLPNLHSLFGSSAGCVGGISRDSPAIPAVCGIFEEVTKEDSK